MFMMVTGKTRSKGTLPDHLVFDEILTRLPAKSLLRLKPVSKNWYSTIRKPSFTRLQHNRAQTRPDGGCLAISIAIPKRSFYTNNFFTSSYQGGPASLLLGTLDYNASVTHGLILLFFNYECKLFRPIFIYNPTTKQHVSLPPISNYIDNPCNNRICVNYYLGYDPFTGLYKALAMCTLSNKSEEEIYYLFIFTLGTETWTWRKLDIAFPRIVSSSACCVNGALHWFVDSPNKDIMNDGYEFILTFDIGAEKFRKLLPISGRPSYMDMLTQVGDKLGLSSYKLGDNGVPEVWVLEDYDKREWIKVKVETPLQWNLDLEVQAIHCGETKMLVTQQRKRNEDLWVYCYDKSGKEWSRFEVTGLPVDMIALELSNNVETLFSLKSNNVAVFNFSKYGIFIH